MSKLFFSLKISLISCLALPNLARSAATMPIEEAWELNKPLRASISTYHNETSTNFQVKKKLSIQGNGGNDNFEIQYQPNGFIRLVPASTTENISNFYTPPYPRADCKKIPFAFPPQWPAASSLVCPTTNPQYVVAVYRDEANNKIQIAKHTLRSKQPSLIAALEGQNFIPAATNPMTTRSGQAFLLFNAPHHTRAQEAHTVIEIETHEGGAVNVYPVTLSMNPTPYYDGHDLFHVANKQFIMRTGLDMLPLSTPLFKVLLDESAYISKLSAFDNESLFEIIIRNPKTSADTAVYYGEHGDVLHREENALRDTNTYLGKTGNLPLVQLHENGAEYDVEYYHLWMAQEMTSKPLSYRLLSFVTLTPTLAYNTLQLHEKNSLHMIADIFSGLAEQLDHSLEQGLAFYRQKLKSLKSQQQHETLQRVLSTPIPAPKEILEYQHFISPTTFSITHRGKNDYPVPTHYWKAQNPKALLLMIHGGPHVHVDAHFDSMIQYHTSRGLSVARPEPRGSSGYGFDHLNAHVNAWNDVDISDIKAVAQHFKNQEKYENIFITGTSYGGYATMAAITKPELSTFFKGAIPGMGVYNVTSQLLEGASSANVTKNDDEYVRHWSGRFGFNPLKEREKADAISPISFLENLHTPVLQIHGFNDSICNISQALELHSASQALNKTIHSVFVQDAGHDYDNKNMFFAFLNLTHTFINGILEGLYKTAEASAEPFVITDFEANYTAIKERLIGEKQAPAAQAENVEPAEQNEDKKPLVQPMKDQCESGCP